VPSQWRRVLAAAGALALAVMGARGAAALSLASRPPPRGAAGPLVTVVALVWLVAGGTVLVYLLLRMRRRREPEAVAATPSPDRWARLVAAASVLVTFTVVVLLLALQRLPAGQHPATTAGPDPSPSRAGDPATTFPHSIAVAAAVGVLLAVVLVGAAIRARRPRRTTAAAVNDAAPATSRLDGAVAAGQDALDASKGDREAILACYAALERALRATPIGRPPADTPSELAERVLAAGLVRPGPVSALTALFREARFSRHPMSPPQRVAARCALAELRRDLSTAESR